ncbi:hypothetical protein [Paracraurococcus ruber]|uniref:Uncharacterized protein n=1 Tax=Paracraurococcus ruber TaxID=77675 RepID=A0ABS1CRK2_9PROT|nr:hypothetical protein [Paracraurococcus ruber]MBK1657075.1 hypothetical protein [Paracraurococcus ruber]TDG33374.1 hypothetical protein E2C05_03895 [Paracraurococcus ruber]
MPRRALPVTLAASLLAPLAVLLALAGPAAAQATDPSFRVVNNTPNVINEVYASPSNENAWGHDRLGSEVVAPGGRHIIRLPQDGNCVYDIRVVYQGGNAEERRRVNTCALTDVVFGGGGAAPRNAQQGNPSFNLVNQSGRVIEEFYASPSSQQNWGPDRLGDATVAPGARFAVRLPQGECSYDLRIVWQGGQSREQRNVNTCALSDYTVR